MALLNATTTYKDPRANILYGGGNNKISDADIKAFISTPGRTNAEVEGAAYKYGVSANQISNAMKGDTSYSAQNVDKYIANQGITKDLAEPAPVPQAAAPERVNFKPISVGNNETVQGRMDGLLKDPNSTMNVQAQTFGNQQANKRGLLNSSIAVSAAQDAAYKNAMPIATQDAATFYDAKKTNSVQDLNAGMFNSDAGTRVNMFNAGTQKDLIQSREGNQVQREGNDLNRFIATMDNDNKLAIANIQAMANDSGIMGDLGKNLMTLYQQTASDPNISPELKTQIFNNLKSQYENTITLLPSFEKYGKKLTFGTPSNDVGTGDIGGTGGATDTSKKPEATNTRSDGAVAAPGKDGKVGSVGSVVPNKAGSGYTVYLPTGPSYANPIGIDTSQFRLSTQESMEIAKFNANNGFERINMDDVVPQSFVDEIARMNNQGMRGFDIGTFAAPIQPPGTMRTDNPAYYIWKAAVPKYS